MIDTILRGRREEQGSFVGVDQVEQEILMPKVVEWPNEMGTVRLRMAWWVVGSGWDHYPEGVVDAKNICTCSDKSLYSAKCELLLL